MYLGKGKRKVVPGLNQTPCCENVWRMEVQLSAFLTLAPDGDE
jgi:hypothetical protein